MDRTTAALAGLLHDIGKFWQRAESKPRAPGYESFDREHYGQNGAHATWSAAFVRHYVPPVFHDIGDAVLYHHQPQDRLTSVVAIADRLASGERADETDEQPRNLLSVFCQLAGLQGGCSQRLYVPLRRLELAEDVLFPVPEAEVEGSPAAYGALWQQFVEEVQHLAHLEDGAAYIESLYYLLLRYTWCVPSAYYRSVPDISLFDHSRVTAAVAACLAELDEDTIDHLLKHPRDNQVPLAYLVEGDISGVQQFIYTLTSKGAVKGLRGRSFYLQLLNMAIARFMLREMALPLTNQIYVGGGRFYLLVPPSEIDRMHALQQWLARFLLRHHEGTLYVALGQSPLTAADFQAGAFSEQWREVGRSVARAKRRRFGDLPPDDLAELVFTPQGHGGNEETECQVCHVERDDIEALTAEEGDEPVRKCPLCRSLEDLGQALSRSELMLLGEMPYPESLQTGTWQDALADLGVSVGLTDGAGRWSLEPNWHQVSRATLLGLHTAPTVDDIAQVTRRAGGPVSAGVHFTANVAPFRPDGRIATFSDMQQAAPGLKRYGVLRMDVDDLGYLFAHGFERAGDQHLSTLGRVASLSLMMGLFFEGWVGKLCLQKNAEVETGVVYTIYSGGDDLFIVGAWHELPGLADAIRHDLRRFAAFNPSVHASAGITLHGGAYPLYQAAREAGAALDNAKDLPGKDAFSFMGQSTPWPVYPELEALHADLVDLQSKPRVGRNLLRLLLQLYEEYRNTPGYTRDGRPQLVFGPWMWHGAYLLTRLADRAGEPVQGDILHIRDQLLEHIELIGLSARWAEALTRPEKSEEREVSN